MYVTNKHGRLYSVMYVTAHKRCTFLSFGNYCFFYRHRAMLFGHYVSFFKYELHPRGDVMCFFMSSLLYFNLM